MSQIHRLYDNIAISNKRSLEVKKIFALSVVAILLLATGCEMGKDGETFLAYSWTSLPLYIYDENPSTPSTITNEEYFRTNEGRYYFEYTAWDGSDWWGTYTITANPGELFTNGAPTYFEIALYSFGPSLYKWSSPRSVDTYPNDRDNGYEKITNNGHTIELEWGSLKE